MKQSIGKMRMALYVLVAGVALQSCSPSGGGTEVPPGFVVGRMYTDEGDAATKAAVRFVRISEQPFGKTTTGEQPRVDEITLVTNDNGEIVFDDQRLEDGYYTVSGELKTLKSYSDSVLFRDGACDSIFDTLRRTGSLTGTVKLYYGDDSRLVSVYLPGTKDFYFIADTSGIFTIDNLAEGTYRARFEAKYPVYLPFDTVVTIKSGHHDTLQNPVNLRYLIQIQGFAAAYDTLMRSVTFNWRSIDSTTIGGYNLEIDNGYSRLPRVLQRDTSFTFYVDDYIGGRLSTISVSNSFMQNYTNWIYISARDVFPVKSIALPTDSVRTKGWALVKNQFYVLRSSLFNSREWSLCVYDKSGIQRSVTSLYATVKKPLAMAAKGDTLYVLESKNDDTLCIHPLLTGDSLGCVSNRFVPSNGGTAANLEFAPDGNVYVSQNLSTWILDSTGKQIELVNNLATHFALSETGLYTYLYGINSPGKSSKLMHFKLQGDTLIPVDTLIYDTYGIVADAPRIFTANNKGVVCCWVDQSIFINYRIGEKEFHARLFLENTSNVVDLLLTEQDELYVLYVTGRIDVVNLSERIDLFEGDAVK